LEARAIILLRGVRELLAPAVLAVTVYLRLAEAVLVVVQLAPQAPRLIFIIAQHLAVRVGVLMSVLRVQEAMGVFRLLSQVLLVAQQQARQALLEAQTSIGRELQAQLWAKAEVAVVVTLPVLVVLAATVGSLVVLAAAVAVERAVVALAEQAPQVL